MKARLDATSRLLTAGAESVAASAITLADMPVGLSDLGMSWSNACRRLRAELGEAVFGAWFARIDLDRVSALAEERATLWGQVADADFLDPAEKRASHQA